MKPGNRSTEAGPGVRGLSVWPRHGKIATAAGSDGRPARTQTRYPIVAAIVFAVSLAVSLAVFQAFARHPWSELDLHIYLWGGTAVRHSQDPYLHTYLRHGLHFTYTPMAAGIFAVLSVASLPIVTIFVLAASVASLVAVLWLTWGSLGRPRSRERLSATLAVAAVALWIEPVRQTLSFGQVNLVLMLIIVADLCLPAARWWKGAGVGLAAGFKLTPLIFIPYLLLTGRFRAAAVAAATFALTIVGSLVLLPKAAHHYWFDGLFLNPNRIGNVHYVGNQSLYGALLRLLGSVTAARPWQLVAEVVVGAAGLALAAWASRRGKEVIGILVCALTGLLISPVSWSHHWVWAAPALVVLVDFATRPQSLAAAARWRRSGWLGAAAVAVVFSGLLWIVPESAVQGYVMTGFEQLVGDLYVLTGLVSLGVIAALLAAAERRTRRLAAAAAAPQIDGEEPLLPGLAARP